MARIINVASEGGKISVDGLAVYNACKSGVIGFTRNIARDYGKSGIAVTCVCPGIMVSERTIRTSLRQVPKGLASLGIHLSPGDYRPMLRYRTRSPASSHS